MIDLQTQEQIVEILQNRASTYGFLSQVYRQEVNTAFLAGLVEQLMGEAEETESEGYRTLRAYAGKLRPEDLDKVQTDLASDYAGLFLNVGRRPVFPFESVYTSPERLIMQRARDEVLAEYRKEGLDRIGEFHEPEDHIAIELEFMEYLCQEAAEAVEAGDKTLALEYLNKQESFLQKHLLVWVPQFCQDVQQVANTGFYKGIAQITDEHLGQEGETIAELVEAVRLSGEG